MVKKVLHPHHLLMTKYTRCARK